jgi:hypothetical protein
MIDQADATAIHNRGENAYRQLTEIKTPIPPAVRQFFNYDLPALTSTILKLLAENTALAAAADATRDVTAADLNRLRQIAEAATNWYDADQAFADAQQLLDGNAFGRVSVAMAAANDCLAATVAELTTGRCIHCGQNRRRADLRLSHPVGPDTGDTYYVLLCRDLATCESNDDQDGGQRD